MVLNWVGNISSYSCMFRMQKMQVWNSSEQEAWDISIFLLAPSHHGPKSVHDLNWAACPAQPPQDTHAHGSRQSWVMLTEPQHAQSQCPGLWLGSVCYHFLQINKCIWGWCMFCTGQNRGSSAGYIEIGIVWLWHCGMYLSLRCTHGGSHTKKTS